MQPAHITYEDIKTILQSSNYAMTKIDHQINSFDSFIQTMVPTVVSEVPMRVLESDKRQHIIHFENVRFCHPTTQESDGIIRYIGPEECCDRGLTYSSAVLVDMRHCVHARTPATAKNKTGGIGAKLEERIYREVCICKLPIMVGSSLCHTRLSGMTDTGGYFIVNGSRKVIVMQETMVTNKPCIMPVTTGKFAYKCEVRSYNEHKVRSTSTLYMYITHDRGGVMPEIVVEVPFCGYGAFPLAVMFRLLGCHDLDKIEQYVTGPLLKKLDDDTLGQTQRNKLKEVCVRTKHLLHSVDESLLTADRPTLLKLLVAKKAVDDNHPKETPEKKIHDLTNLIQNEVLPHLKVAFDGEDVDGDADVLKCHFLGMMARELLQVQLKMRQCDDRDDLRNKCAVTPGMNLALLFRKLLRKLKDQIARELKKWVETRKNNEIVDAVKKYITRGIKTALSKGDFGVKGGGSQQEGVAQALSTQNVGATLSHLRKLNMPSTKDGKMPKPRMLHLSHHHLICPCETPEGKGCGLLKNLAFMTHVRIGHPSKPIIDLFTQLPEFSAITADLSFQDKAFLQINGTLVGYISDIDRVRQQARRWRQDGAMPFDVTIAVDQCGLHINTYDGALLHPVFVASSLSMTKQLVAGCPKHLLWTELLHSGCIEYVDKNEEVDLLIAQCMAQFIHEGPGTAKNTPFTHVEIHPTMMLGTRAGFIPFPNHNPSPRNGYAAGMTKQAISEITETGETRMETLQHRLDTLQKPLVKTLMHDLMPPEHGEIGQNVLCAVMSYTGYNQEDSIIMNKSSVDRGLFRSTFYRTHVDREKVAASDVMSFQKPNEKTAVGMKHANYDELESDGLVAPGTKVTPEHVIIGKVSSSCPMGTANHRASKQRTKITHDHSTVLRHSENMIVDSVMITASDKGRNVKVMTRTTRRPEVGDKFSSRHSQKGVLGMLMSQEDMPFVAAGNFAGMVPDIIINPHCMPSRMTGGHQLEALASKVAALQGTQYDGTPFENHSGAWSSEDKSVVEHLGELLKALGEHPQGKVRMCNGMTGELLEADIYYCPMYYMRLKHMVEDKLHARSHGPVQILTRQPAGGRSKDGGLRIGEMERDTIVAHGAANFLRDRLLYQSDYYKAHICGQCGHFAQAPKPEEAQMLRAEVAHCMTCGTGQFVSTVELPYAAKLLTQELQAMHLDLVFNLESDP